MGNPRDEHLSDEQKKVIAVHESGHALVALLSPHSNPVTKITIIPRGRALGFTEQTPLEDQVNHTKSYLLTQIAILLGGRMAEKIVVGDITTGAQDDLKRATKMARSMVANFGMSETFGLLSLDLDSTHPFLGKEMGKSRDFSEETARKVDEEVLSILKEREEYVMDLLNKNIDKLKALTDKVFEEETLDQAQIENCLS
jgi:cell division protease FtsH